MSPFDFVKQINHGKINLMDETPELEKEYKQFIINRALSLITIQSFMQTK